MGSRDLKERGRIKQAEVMTSWRGENGSTNIWLDAFSLCFFPLLIVSLPGCFLKRLTLPKILIILKVTHRQVGKANPRPQILDSNLVKGYATHIPLQF